MTKLKKAPHFDKQLKQCSIVEDWYVLVGKNAHFAYYHNGKEAGRATEWEFIRDVYKCPVDYHPVIIDGKQFNEIGHLQIAPTGQMRIKFFQVGDIPELAKDGDDLKTRILMNLAKHNPKIVAIEWLDQALQGENLYEQLQQIRNGQSTVAEVLAAQTPTTQNKNQPYIEKRTESGLKGLYRITPKYNSETGELLSERTEWLSDCVDVVGVGNGGGKYYLILQFQPENQTKKVLDILPLEDVGEREGWKQLKDKGLRVCSKTYLRNELADYLQNSGNREPWAVVHSAGWHNGAYILPSGEIIGTPNTPTLFRSQADAKGYHTSGTLESWQANVAKYADKNPFMMLGVAVALSAPLVSLLDAENFGVHLYGGSTEGKTTTAEIALSVWGYPKEIALSWDGTAKGITAQAVERCDCLVALDEIGQSAKIKDVETVSYTLFNGIGRMRADIHGNARAVARWQTVAFSTGEVDIETFLAKGGIKVKAGQLVRLLNVPIARAKHYHGLADGVTHAEHLKQATKQHYGTVGRTWIEWLLQPQSQTLAKTVYAEQRAKWLDRLPADSSPQVQRVAGRFAVLETALQLAKHLTLWDVHTNSEALLHCFNEWVNEYGLHSREEQQIIEQVNGWLLANAEGRFVRFPIDEKQRQTIHNIAGYRMVLTSENDKEHFYVHTHAFPELINGHPKKQACQILADKGMLKRGREQGREFMVKLPHNVDPKRSRCYLLYPLFEPEEEQEPTQETND